MQVRQRVAHLREPCADLLFFEFCSRSLGLVDVLRQIALRAPLHDQVEASCVVLEAALEALDEFDDARVVQRF